MFTKIRRKFKDQIFFGTAVVTAGVFVACIFSYLLQLALARFLSVSDYGTFNALLAMASIVGVPGAVFSISLIKSVSELKAANDYKKLTKLFWGATSGVLSLGFIFSLLIFVSRRLIGGYLNIVDFPLITIFGLFLGLSFINIIPSAYLQGLQRFKAFAFYNVFNGLLRFMFPVSFVLIGLGLRGIFIAHIFFVSLAFAVGAFLLKKNLRAFSDQSISQYYKKILVFSVPVLFVNLGLMLLNNLDVVLVKRFFSEYEAGYYSGVVTVGKILLFGAGTVVVVMFPQISELYARGVKFTKRFLQFFCLQVLIAGIGVTIFSLFPFLITHTMFGVRFSPSSQYVPLFSVFVGLYVMVNFMIMFFLAINRPFVFLFQIPAVIAQYVLISRFHQSLYDVIKINIGVTALLLISILMYYSIDARINNRSRLQAGEND